MNHKITIEKIIAGGFGLGRLKNGMIVMTRFVLPGETVLIREIAQQRGYIEAELHEILEASPDRIEPPCPYFTICGGCDLQHMSLPLQHQVKTAIVQESMARAHVPLEQTSFEPLLPSPEPFHYRYRLRLKIGENGRIGFYQANTNDLVEINNCLLATEKINKTLAELIATDKLRNQSKDINEIEILESPSDKQIFIILHLNNRADVKQVKAELIESFATENKIILFKKGKRIQELFSNGSSPPVLSQEFNKTNGFPPFRLSWSPGCFFQVNAQQNEQLIELASRYFSKTGGQNVLDLYCGMGNFSVPIGMACSEISGIEQNPESIRWAKFNAENAGIQNYFFQANDVGRYLRESKRVKANFDVVFLDPPRKGMGKHIRHINRLAPKYIIYISCDPATMARDIAGLTKNDYSLKKLTPVDMFPQTHHIESVALLEKN